MSIAGVQGVFDDDGRCTDPGVENALQGAATSLLGFLKEYVCPKQALEAMVRGDAPAWTANV